MPNRIIKETICTSEEIEALTAEQEVFFYRLMVSCDDFGLFDGRPKIIASKCYPLKSLDIKCVQMMLDALICNHLISMYEVGGRPYLHITNWEKHQQIRAKRAKYPMPSEGRAITCNQLISSDIGCNHLQAFAPVIQSNPIRIQSESESESESKVTPAVAVATEETDLQKSCKAVWYAYADSYESRYGVKPVRNAKVNGQVKQFVQRVGSEEGPHIAGWFVSHPGQFYAGRMHDFGCLLSDAEKLRTEWATGRVMTQSKARQSDRTGGTMAALAEVLADQGAAA